MLTNPLSTNPNPNPNPNPNTNVKGGAITLVSSVGAAAAVVAVFRLG